MEPIARPTSILNDVLPILILLVLSAYGIYLYFKTKYIKSKYLKTAIYIPLIIFLWGTIWWFADTVLMNPFHIDFADYLIIAFFFGIPLSIVSIIISLISIVKLKEKMYPVLAIIYSCLYLIISIVFTFLFLAKGM